MRLFVAVPLPDLLERQLTQIIASLALPQVRWTRPEARHLTLKFLGDVAPDAVAPLNEVLADVAQHNDAFQVALRGGGQFPAEGDARVLWLGVADPAGALAGLADAIERAVVPLGLLPEERAFVPHLTLGRTRAPVRAPPALCTLDTPLLLDVHEFVLFQSTLRSDGAVHTVHARWSLGEPKSVTRD